MHSLARIVLVLAIAIISTCSATIVRPTSPMKLGYWGSNPAGTTSSISQVETALDNGYNVIMFAFYNVQANGNMFLDAGSVTPTRKSQIHTTSQFTYLASLFGGQSGSAPTITMSANAFAQVMFNNFVTLQSQYEFDGVHIDMSSTWGATPDVMVCALRSFIKSMHNAGYVVSMAPGPTAVSQSTWLYASGSWNAFVPLLDTGIISNVDIVAIKMYGDVIYGNSAATYTDSLTNGFSVTGSPTCDGTVTGKVQIPASKLAHGWPAASTATSGCPGQASGCPYGSALTTLYAGSTSLKSTAGVMTWAIEIDAANNWQFINAATSIPFSGASVPSNPATAAPVAPTQAPTSRPATQAPTSKPATPATAAPVPPTSAAVAPTAAPVGSTTCKMTWTHTLSSSWTQGCNTVSMYTATMYADAPLSNFHFTLAGNGPITSVWDAATDSTGAYVLPSWLFSGGTMAKGQVASFGYIIVSNSPATVSVQGNPCQ